MSNHELPTNIPSSDEELNASATEDRSVHWSYEVTEDGHRVPHKRLSPDTYIPGVPAYQRFIEKPLIDERSGQELTRHRPGSAYVEINLENEDLSTLVEKYRDLLELKIEADNERYPYLAPENYPLQSAAEEHLLHTLIEQNGYINFQDAATELSNQHKQLNSENYLAAVRHFISQLDLTPSIVPEVETKKGLSRRALVQKAGVAALGIAGVGVAVTAPNAPAIIESLKGNEVEPIYYPVTGNDSGGVWEIVQSVYDLSPDQTTEYIRTKRIVIYDTEGDVADRSLDEIYPGDVLELPQP